MLRTPGAMIHGVGEKWSIEGIDVSTSAPGEVLIKVRGTCLCHSGYHLVVVDSSQLARAQVPAFGTTDTFVSLDEARLLVAKITSGRNTDIPADRLHRRDPGHADPRRGDLQPRRSTRSAIS